MDEPYHSNVPAIPDHNWEHSVYGKHEEDIIKDVPEPLGKGIVLTHYFNTSFMHDILPRKAVTGVCTFYNKTPTDWYCKQKSTSETATYTAEFLSGRKCCENIIDHQAYLRYLEKSVDKMDYVWEDNESMINSSIIPEAKLHKQHNILSFHYVRSMISQGYINLQHLASHSNFADVLTKNWSYQSSYCELIQPISLESDVSIAEESILSILGSDKCLSRPITEGEQATGVCGTCTTIKED